MSEMNLPEGWVETPLGEYLYLKNGYAFKSNSYVAKSDDTVPVIRISDIDGKIAHDEAAIHVKKADVVDGFEIKNGDLLIAMSGATTGKVGVYKGSEPAYQNQRGGNLKLHSNEHGSPKYKNHLIASLTPDILKIAYGGAQPNISGKAIEDLLVALPPLAEQQQIAQKLDELLAQVDTLKTRLDAIPKILKRFRQSVLAAAVSGRLTEEWRGHSVLTPPIKTWPSAKIIDQAFCVPEDWLGVSLGSVSARVSVGHVGKTSEFYSDDKKAIPFLRSQNVRPGRISLDGLAYITPDFHKTLKKSQLKEGDLLVVRVGANRGDSCVLPKIFDQVNCANIVFARPLSGLSDYLNLYFQSPISQTLLLGESVGGAQGVINTKSVESTFLALPPLEEQTEIVRRVEQLFAYADQIEQRVKDAQARVNHLTQSILAKAFRGELTADWRAQNPELISGENSAAALLERIRAERETTVKPKRKVKA